MTLYIKNSRKNASVNIAMKSSGSGRYLNAKPHAKMKMMLKNIMCKY